MDMEGLAKELSHVFETPRFRKGNKAPLIVRTIINAMTKALQMGEEVNIAGFGILRVRYKAPQKQGCNFFRGREFTTYIMEAPARFYVHFEPSKPFVRMINDERYDSYHTPKD